MSERVWVVTPGGANVEVKAEKVDMYLAAGFTLGGGAPTQEVQPTELKPMRKRRQPTREASPLEESDDEVKAVRKPKS